MKKYNISEVLPGMVTAASVHTKRGQLIVNPHVVLTPSLITRMEFYGITVIEVEEDSESDLSDAQPALSAPLASKVKRALDPSYSQKLRISPEFQKFQVNFMVCSNDLRECFDAFINSGGTVNKEELLQKTSSLIEGNRTTIEIFDMLHNMRKIDDSTYAHSLNVALISRMIGKWLHFSAEDLDSLTLAGLLHDIGKIKVPADVLNKTEKLTDDEFRLIRQHPQFGYDILKKQPLDSPIRRAALQHHERCDGSGYPMGLTLDEIDDYALIIAIADVYDAMTAARSYRAPLCPFQVIAEFEKDGLQKYKPKYILTFLEHIAATYQNNRVQLSDGSLAKIVLLNSSHLSKPLVQLTDGSCIDLDKSPLFIQSLI